MPADAPRRRAGAVPALIASAVLLSAAGPPAATTTAAPAAEARDPMLAAVGAPQAPGLEARRAALLDRLRGHAERAGIPADLADAVAVVESGYQVAAIGADGEVGLMQILPATAAMLGHRDGRDTLFDPDTNMRLAVRYLAGAWALADGNLCRALSKYRAGHGEDRITPLSLRYCRRALEHLAAIRSPLALGPGAVLPTATAADAAVPRFVRGPVRLSRAELGRLRAGQRTQADSQRYWAAHEARIRVLRERLRR